MYRHSNVAVCCPLYENPFHLQGFQFASGITSEVHGAIAALAFEGRILAGEARTRHEHLVANLTAEAG